MIYHFLLVKRSSAIDIVRTKYYTYYFTATQLSDR